MIFEDGLGWQEKCNCILDVPAPLVFSIQQVHRRRMMNGIHKLGPISGVVLVSLLAACSLPASATPFAIPTPNLTLTALFQPTETIPASVTPPAVITATPADNALASPTPVPTQTDAPAGGTGEPTTSAATVTAVLVSGPDQRSGVSVQAAFFTESPIIDANMDEWSFDEYRIVDVVYGSVNHTNLADLSAQMMIGWDETSLYLAAFVEDDVIVQNETGLYLYRGDSVEVLLDTNVSLDYYTTFLSNDDFQLGISPGFPTGTNPRAYLWYPAASAGARSQIEIAASPTSTGYQIEIAIPWSVFNVTPDAGDHFGFGFSLSDNDSVGVSVQQSMVSNLNDRDFLDPTTWGDLTLLGP
jgi:hypothetical protein